MEGRISQTNGRLRTARVGVTVVTRGNRLYLRATFPPKPGTSSTQPSQQRLALGYHANPAGLKLAESEARKIGALLDCGEFQWEPYLKNYVQANTVADWWDKFEADYFNRRERNPKSETTWRKDYQQVFSALPPDEPLSVQLLVTAITATKPDTKTRQRFTMVCTSLARFAGLEADFKGLRGNYSSKSVSPRNIPEDRVIAEWREKIPNPLWRRAYGLIATYRLRPHEVFHLDFSKMPVLVVLDDTKTGYHRIYPFYPEWVEQWGLVGELPAVTGKDNSALGNRVSSAFNRYKIPFVPYDLRHAWAVRNIAFHMPTTLSARMMAHSVEVHEKVYQRWITEDFEAQVVERLMKGDRPLPPSN
jgi:integrase